MDSIPEHQQRRAEFLIELLHTEEAKNLLKRKGITDHSFIKRLCNNLWEHGTLLTLHARVETPSELMAACLQWCLLACIPVGCIGCQRQLCMHATNTSSWLSCIGGADSHWSSAASAPTTLYQAAAMQTPPSITMHTPQLLS